MAKVSSCSCGCGKPVDVKKHQLSLACYARIRHWSNARSPVDRAEYKDKLITRLTGINMIDQKLVVIGKSKYTWKRTESNVIRLNFRRQRGNVR